MEAKVVFIVYYYGFELFITSVLIWFTVIKLVSKRLLQQCLIFMQNCDLFLPEEINHFCPHKYVRQFEIILKHKNCI